MRKLVIWGFVLVSLTALLAGSGASAPRERVIEAAASRPAQVEVTNFPAVQAVSGTVNVTNLPAVQNVAGSMEVSNLPLDAAGNLRVSSATLPQTPQIHFIGFTKPVDLSDVFGMSTECNTEFPGTRACKADEFLYAVPPPTDWPGDRAGVLPPLDAPFRCVNRSYQSGCATGGVFPAACCGY
jgi:hypothetical protein